MLVNGVQTFNPLGGGNVAAGRAANPYNVGPNGKDARWAAAEPWTQAGQSATSYFSGLDPQAQYDALMSTRGLHGALINEGMDPNQLNQFINGASYHGADANVLDPSITFGSYGGATNTGTGLTPGSNFGASMFDGWPGGNPLAPGGPMNPGAAAGGAPGPTGSPTPGPVTPQMQPKSMASILGSSTNSGTAPTGSPGSAPVPLPTSDSGYALNPSAYQNPMEDFLQSWGTHDLNSSYGAAGDFLSGAAGRGLSDYAAKTAAATSYLPALSAAEDQQGKAIGLGEFNRNLDFQSAMADNTIPFQQKLALAQLGMQGAQGTQSVQNLLATLLSQNAIAAGTAAGTGTIGQGNAVNSAISNIINNLQGNASLSRILSMFGGAPQ